MPAFLLGDCGLCDRVFTSNPERVPCFPLRRRDNDGSALQPMDARRFHPQAPKEPVCRDCFDAINRYREKNGERAHVALKGAWDSAEVSYDTDV